MKKRCVFWALLCFASVSGAAGLGAYRVSVYVEGMAPDPAMQNFFMANFSMEAEVMFGAVASAREEADYTFHFAVSPNTVLWADGSLTMAPPDQPQYVIHINFIRNSDGVEIVYFYHSFSDYAEMSDFNQLLVFRAAILIPYEAGLLIDDRWQFQTFPLRASLDFPVALQSPRQGDLQGWMFEYAFLPAVTVGFGALLLDWLGVEPFFHIGLGFLQPAPFYLRMDMGLEIQFPFRVSPWLLLTPYALLSYTIHNAMLGSGRSYYDFPPFALGGGLQAGMRAGGRSSLFFNLSFKLHVGDLVLQNNIYGAEDVSLRRLVFMIGAGYRLGLFGREGGLFSGRR